MFGWGISIETHLLQCNIRQIFRGVIPGSLYGICNPSRTHSSIAFGSAWYHAFNHIIITFQKRWKIKHYQSQLLCKSSPACRWNSFLLIPIRPFLFYSIAFLETAILSVFNWISAKYLTLSPEFLIIGLPQQLSKLSSLTIRSSNNATLSPVDSARSLEIIHDKNLSYAQHSFSVSNSNFLIFAISDTNEISLNPHHVSTTEDYFSHSIRNRLLHLSSSYSNQLCSTWTQFCCTCSHSKSKTSSFNSLP